MCPAVLFYSFICPVGLTTLCARWSLLLFEMHIFSQNMLIGHKEKNCEFCESVEGKNSDICRLAEGKREGCTINQLVEGNKKKKKSVDQVQEKNVRSAD